MPSGLRKKAPVRLEQVSELRGLALTLGFDLSRTPREELPSALVRISIALRQQFEQAKEVPYLSAAVRFAEGAVSAISHDHPDRGMALANLRVVLQSRFDQARVLDDLDLAVWAGVEAIAATSADHPFRARRLSGLGETLTSRYEWTHVPADLDAAIEITREAVSCASTDGPDRALTLSDVGAALLLRFERTQLPADLDGAVQALESAVSATTTDLNRARRLARLGIALRMRFARTGALAELDAAVDACLRATAADPDDDIAQSALGTALHSRFERRGALADLDLAVHAHRKAVAITSPGDLDRPAWLSNLGIALRTRFNRLGAVEDLDEAVDANGEAVATTQPHDPLRAAWLSNHADTLRTRFERTGTAEDTTDLDAAVEVGHEAVAAHPAGAPDRAPACSNLGNALLIRYQLRELEADLKSAVENLRKSVAATADGHPARATRLSNLGKALWIQHQRTGTRADLELAVATYAEAATLETAAPSVRIRATRVASTLAAAAQPALAADLLRRAVLLLPEVTPRQIVPPDQRYALTSALSGLSGLAADAAALTLSDPSLAPESRASLALRFAEAGRAVLLSQALEVRSDLSDLADRHPLLAERLTRIRVLLDQDPGVGPGSPVDAARTAGDRLRLADELAEVLDEIRAQQGFDSFGRPLSEGDLLGQAEDGPLVVFNISFHRSDALLVTPTGVTSLPLPDLGHHTLVEQIRTFYEALGTAGDGMATEADRKSAQHTLNGILQWLWDCAAGPVLHALGHHAGHEDGEWPRVWWIPGGLLALLPIHAAGHHSDPPGPGARSVIDRVISSYTPTIAALRHARRTTALPRVPDSALIVAMPVTPGLPGNGRLRHVGGEAANLAKLVARSIMLVEPDPLDLVAAADDSLPLLATVLSHLEKCPIAHFACHGTHDPHNPSNSRLLLHDHATAPLTVAALSPLHLDQAQLAYLSACETAISTNSQLVDEAIHLASAFQLAGYRHVIGTLWTINDSSAARVANAFYAHLTRAGAPDTNRSAHALHHAVRSARNARPTAPVLWAAHIHSGA
ncbi:CHAT domain-containing protein [Amycolatopsis sp. NPDC051758]|uniref:CHAT domain-containing tetratricopeptide repeat protein n=1 Tax=Amycolatopsis sp. NPDC051758 TaxID=3363935 RepID=UPI0037A84A7D